MKNCIYIFLITLLLTSCGTIVGGARYTAHVEVKNHPDALIFHENEQIGVGTAKFLHKRKHANKLEIIVKKDGCNDYSVKYDSKVPRLFPVIGSVSEAVQFVTIREALVIPLGSIIDIVTGGYFKPNASKPGVTKLDYDNFKYTIDYPNCTKK